MTLPIGEYRPNYRSPLGRALAWSLMFHGFVLLPAVLPMVQPWWRTGGEGMLRATLRGRALLPTPAVAQVPKAVAAPVSPQSLSPVSVPSTVAAAGANAAPTVNANNEGVDAESLRAYRMTLAVQARRYWHYPPEARQGRQQGTVLLRISVLPSSVGTVAVEQSSGYPRLDEAALSMVRQAQSGAVLPEALRDRAFSMTLPLVFSLD